MGGAEGDPGVGEQPARPVVRRIADRRGSGSESQVVLLDGRGLHQPSEHGGRAVDVTVHRDPGRTQQHPGPAVGVDRVYDDRLGLARHELRHHSRGSDLEVRDGGHLGRVAAEVAGDQHTVDLVRGQESRHRPDVGHRVLLPRAGQVDRVGHRGARSQQGAQRRTRDLGEHGRLEADSCQRVGGDRAVTAAVGEDRDASAGHAAVAEQAVQQVGHLGRVVHAVGAGGGTGRVDHPVGAGQ